MRGSRLFFFIFPAFILISCSASRPLTRNGDAFNAFINDSIFSTAQLGVSVYDPESAKYIYDKSGGRYFVPASNVKIATCYAAMRSLKHILSGARYYENDTAIYLIPTGDPTLLHRDFPNQPLIRFLQQVNKHIYVTDLNWKDKELGKGWSWDDYNEGYMAERNAMPVYGNVIRWIQQKVQNNENGNERSVSVYSDPEVNWKLWFQTGSSDSSFHVVRERNANVFYVTEGKEDSAEQSVPFVVNGIQSSIELLKDSTGKQISLFNRISLTDPSEKEILSQPLDSVLRPMMYRSDNFFAEQLLLMISAVRTGVMNDELVTDTILKTDLQTLKEKPVWADGSGMSRYNLFTPHNFVEILTRMRSEFGMDRIRTIFPSGNSGTLKGYYKNDSGNIYAKTGSMTGVIAISGFLITKKKRPLIFSILINNYTGNTRLARKRIERFLEELMK